MLSEVASSTNTAMVVGRRAENTKISQHAMTESRLPS